MSNITGEMISAVLDDEIDRRTFASRFGVSDRMAGQMVYAIRYMDSNNNHQSTLDGGTRIIEAPKPEIHKVDIMGMLDEAETIQDSNKRLSPQDHSLEVEIELEPNKDGMAYMFWGADLHAGNAWTDYGAIKKFLQYIEDNNIAFCLLGDIVEGFIRPMKNNWLPVLSQIWNPQKQFMFKVNLLKRFIENGTLKFILEGNHDKRTHLLTGIDALNIIDWKIPVKHNRAIVTVKCGEAVYRGLAIHKSTKGRSVHNPMHSLTRELRETYPDLDFMVAAHEHHGAMSYFPYCGRKIPLIRVGCFNSDADYALSAYGKTAFIDMPLLGFDARKRVSSPLVVGGFYLDKMIKVVFDEGM